MQGGQGAGQAPVAFLWPGGIQVVGAQAGFYMGDGDLLVIGRQAGGKRGRGVAMHQHHIGLEFGQYRLDTLQNPGGHAGQVLAGFHDVQVVIRGDTEQFQYLVEHLPVLAGDAHAGFEAAVLRQLQG
ncbi:hypothetical protein D3C75_970860 [compost metagenome]